MISYSLHLSSKKHALTSTRKVAGSSKHNLRQYESSQYCRDNIFVLIGGDNILDDLKNAYHQEFDACLEEYNKGKRSDRRIDDYLKYVSESGKNDVAAEMIIQLGDAEFWNDKSLSEKKAMIPIFSEQIKYLEELVPNFRIISAVVHLDEKSPHAHIIGIPIGSGYTRGMNKQVAKTKVFTQESLRVLQEKMHAKAEQDMASHPEIFSGESIKEIEKGRNSDWSKEYFIKQKADKAEAMDAHLAAMTSKVTAYENTLTKLNEQMEKKIHDIVETEAQKDFMKLAFLENPKTPLGKIVSEAWKRFKKWWDEHKRQGVEQRTRESVLGKLEKFKKEVDDEPKHSICISKKRRPELK